MASVELLLTTHNYYAIFGVPLGHRKCPESLEEMVRRTTRTRIVGLWVSFSVS